MTIPVLLKHIAHFILTILISNVPFQVISGNCLIYAFWQSVLLSSVVGIILIFIQFLIPLFILIYCYGRIVWILIRGIDSKLNNTSGGADTFQTARNNTTKTLLIVALCFIICWSNNQVYYTMYNLGYQVDWNGVYYKFTVLMVFLNCTVNPFIYLVKYKDYQVALRSLLDHNRKWDRKRVVTMDSNCSDSSDVSRTRNKSNIDLNGISK